MIRSLALVAFIAPMPAAAFTPLDYETCVLRLASAVALQRTVDLKLAEESAALAKAAPAGDNPTATASAAAETARVTATEAIIAFRDAIAAACDTLRD